METINLKEIVYNIEQENLIKEEEVRSEVENKAEKEIIEDFENQQLADDSGLDDTPADVENENMQILLDAA
jgi:hypothetical protein